jgi:hypothetical protein
MIIKKFSILVLFFLSIASVALYAEERGIKTPGSQSQKPTILGNYAAFIVGIDKYKEWYPLQTAVKDATALKGLLIRQYSFDKVLLIADQDATQLNIIKALKKFASGLKESDNLLIYYAGHGQLDEFTGDGYWIPVDGKHKDSTTWISHLIIKSILGSERVRAKSIALISDSCYAGALLRSGASPVAVEDEKYEGKILALSARKSRQVFTSGGLEPVADGGRDGHSLFAYYFLKALKENSRDIIDLENLFYSRVWGPVAELGNQRPYVGRLKSLMDENGQFVLVTRSARDKNWDELVDLSYAAVSPELYYKPGGRPNFNPAEPWTGVWKVESRYYHGLWVMKQSGNRVRSAGDSRFYIRGAVNGNQLKGNVNRGSPSPFILKISLDRQSWEGNVKIHQGYANIKAGREE